MPKIAKDNDNINESVFIYMLAYVLNLKLENEQVASGENIKLNKIVEILINVFAKNLISELKKGIYKEYILKQDNLRTLKGKYLINENLKYNFTINRRESQRF